MNVHDQYLEIRIQIERIDVMENNEKENYGLQ